MITVITVGLLIFEDLVEENPEEVVLCARVVVTAETSSTSDATTGDDPREGCNDEVEARREQEEAESPRARLA